MAKKTILITVLLISFVLGIAHVAHYYPKLPDTVATHFNGAGEADGFSSKQTHATLMISLQLGMMALFLGLGWLIRVLPANLINIPHRDYWLSAERKESTIAKMFAGMLTMAIGTQWFFIGLDHITTLHNLGSPAMKWFWPIFGIYMSFVIGFCIWLSIKFRLPADAKDAGGQMLKNNGGQRTIKT